MRENWPFGDLEPGAYGLIVADPPWNFQTYSQKGKEKKSADLHYSTMSLEEIKALPVSELADPKGCFLWLWTTAPMLVHGIGVLEAWGFEYSTHGIWHKRTKNGLTGFGTGYIFRNSHEPYLIGRHGSPKTSARNVRSIIEGPIREHSRKPDQAYDAAERLFGDVRRADLFGRETRPGWDGWGNEATKFDVKEAA
jgi:N6-adenosine-specific RNA methylase IME4